MKIELEVPHEDVKKLLEEKLSEQLGKKVKVSSATYYGGTQREPYSFWKVSAEIIE